MRIPLYSQGTCFKAIVCARPSAFITSQGREWPWRASLCAQRLLSPSPASFAMTGRDHWAAGIFVGREAAQCPFPLPEASECLHLIEVVQDPPLQLLVTLFVSNSVRPYGL